MRFLSCLDSPALAESRRRELVISRESASQLGRSAVAAATAGVYENSIGEDVDFRAAVQAACAAKVSIPPDAALPQAWPKPPQVRACKMESEGERLFAPHLPTNLS